jgi:uncharacterized protein (TIGR02594 family)
MTHVWYEEARRLIGTREIKGPKHNPTIMGWVKNLGSKVLGIQVKDDETPWCGTYVAHCMNVAGIAAPPVAVRAKSWATWGSNLRATHLTPGAVLVFERPGGGHVGFYVAEDEVCYHVLGGNQSNMVNITRIEKSRCVARRWPKGVKWSGGPVWVKSNGTISRDEA